jgi:hypothetical protein
VDKHTLAAISITGSALDMFGGLYLAYDLLGGKHGPLRTIARAVTYGVLFGVGYGLALGLAFGVAGGLSHGITLGLEFSWAARTEAQPPFWRDFLFSAIRGLGFGIAASFLYGTEFGAVFGLLSTAGQTLVYRLGLRPSMAYRPGRRPGITRGQWLAALNRTAGYTAAGYLSAVIAHHQMHALGFGVRAGLAIGVVSAVATAIAPFVEWTAESLPDRRLGVLGIAMMLTGFSLQSVQYWMTLLDVAVR